MQKPHEQRRACDKAMVTCDWHPSKSGILFRECLTIFWNTSILYQKNFKIKSGVTKIQLCCVKYKLTMKLQSLVRRARGTRMSTENCWNHPQMYCNTIQSLIFMVYSIAYWDLFLLFCLSCSCCAYKTENRDVKPNDV